MIPAAVVLSMLAPAPAPAQTFDEAVRANLGIALQLCVQNSANLFGAVAAFQQAGFVYKPSSEANGDIWHRFFAPAETVRAELLQGQMAPSCDVYTNHLPPAQAAPLIGALLNQIAPGRFTPDPQTYGACALFADNSRAIPLVVSVGAVDGTSGCPALGSTIISTFSAV